ncbi:unnamed protein product [Lactuca saligna]|uniref:Uncharacterized protein n=1 Tax=Lactuca saligna TaxID=75948 RepID=A0AA35Y8N8_LACSI|nr:unnamed protein product [Lactuca saligna]
MENSFEVPNLVFHGRKSFGIVIWREKDDSIKIFEEDTERMMVVAIEARMLKKADFDKKFNALDQHKKIIYMNNTVRVLEGPLEVWAVFNCCNDNWQTVWDVLNPGFLAKGILQHVY